MSSILAQQSANKNIFKDRFGVIAGAGRSGIAAAKVLHMLGAKVRIVDENTSLEENILEGLGADAQLKTGPLSASGFEGADIIVLSPGIPSRKIKELLPEFPDEKIISELELASSLTDEPIIAITGTNGKTTTTSIISHVLEYAGKSVFTGGNIGTPLCEHLLQDKRSDVLVLEVSSFQLQNCYNFRPDAAILLNISANHLDYHLDMEEYTEAKLNIFKKQTADDLAIIAEEMKPMLGSRNFTKAEIKYFNNDSVEEIPNLPGPHNRGNMHAAMLATAKFGVTAELFIKAVREFKGKPHRIEYLGTVNGVKFIDDSKATNLDAVCAALNSCSSPVRLLLGGHFKGGDVTTIIPSMQGKVVEVGLFGAGREYFEAPLKKEFPTSWNEKLEDAVRKLFSTANCGDTILLSPATASFDAYKSYAARGDDFKRIMEELS
jgi:UDP-N-acetylmuramoylalanine--D-glutamate ligase